MTNADQYQTVNKDDKYYVSIAELAHMLLSQYKDTASVKLALQKYKVWGDKSTNIDGVPLMLHYYILDKNGKGLVVEFKKGKMSMHDVNTKVQVMANAPSYDWQLNNLDVFTNYYKQSSGLSHTNESDDDSPININSFIGMQGDVFSPTRFIKASVLGRAVIKSGPKDESYVNKISQVLKTVNTPVGTESKGTVKNPIETHTSFVLIKDLSSNMLYVTSYYHSQNPAVIDLNELDKKHAKQFDISISDLPYPSNDITNKLLSS
jgi:choloylglycine hydrolase